MNKTQIQHILQQLHLSENEALLYEVMLSNPRVSVQELAKRVALPRTLLYYVLNQLQERGLVTSHKNGPKTLFVLETPEKLHDLLSKNEREFEKTKRDIQALIPALKNKYNRAGARPSVRTFEGIDGFSRVLQELASSKPKYILMYESLGEQKPGLEIREHFEHTCIRRKIKRSILFSENKRSLEDLKSRQYNDYTQYRSVNNKDITIFQADLYIVDSSVLLVRSVGNDIVAFLFEDQQFAQMQRLLFDILWKSGKHQTLAFMN